MYIHSFSNLFRGSTRIRIVALTFLFISSWPTVLVAAEVAQSMPLQNKVGSECPMTGVKVEDVIPAGGEQEIIVSIPRAALAARPNLKLFNLDDRGFSYSEFKELRANETDDRRVFSVVIARNDKLSFKVGFDSKQWR